MCIIVYSSSEWFKFVYHMIQQFILLLNAQVVVSSMYDTAVYIVAQCSSIFIIYDTAVYIVAQVGVSLDTIRRVALRHPPFHALLFGNSMFMFNTLTINNNRKI